MQCQMFKIILKFMSIDSRPHSISYMSETPVSKICMVSDEKKIQMQKGEMTRAIKVAQIPNRGLAPGEFSYWRYELNLFGAYMLVLCPEIVTCDDGKICYPLSGPLTIKWCNVWIPHKGHGMWFKSKEDYVKLKHELSTEYNEKSRSILNKVYEMDIHGRWGQSSTYLNQSNFHLVGYEHYLEKIEHDINIHKQYAEILAALGETKSINYLLYGPPGTGKTTLIRSLASKYNYPVCVVKPNTLRSNTIGLALNPVLPNETHNDFVFVIFEDFDRFIEITNGENTNSTKEASNVIMSQILNSLDGFGDNGNVVRFFTGNDYDKIKQNEALLNRMSSRFEFAYPQIQSFSDKFNALLKVKDPTEIDTTKTEAFINTVSTINKLTLRPFTNYVIRYLFCDDYMDKLISNIAELS
jgi:hypothetical protein